MLYQGVKLNLQSQVSSVLVNPGEFFVLIPFTKKERPQTSKPDFSEVSSSVGNHDISAKKFADSTYSDVMQELSSLHQEGLSNISSNVSDGMDFRNMNREPLQTKHKKGDGHDNKEVRFYEFVRSVLRSKNSSALGGQSCEKFVEVLKSVNCLSNPNSGKCMMMTEANRRNSGGRNNGSSCLCPVWLKRVVEAFAFLSIFSAHLQLQGKQVTLSHLQNTLNQLGKLGIQVDMKDIEHLSSLCPKVGH